MSALPLAKLLTVGIVSEYLTMTASTERQGLELLFLIPSLLDKTFKAD